MHSARRKVIVAFVVLILITAMVAAYKMYTKPHRVVANEEAIVVIAPDLFLHFEQDEEKANEMYLDKVLKVTGRVSEVSTNMVGKQVVLLEADDMIFGVRCTLEDSASHVRPGTTVTIRGICTGYLSDVIITNGVYEDEEPGVKE